MMQTHKEQQLNKKVKQGDLFVAFFANKEKIRYLHLAIEDSHESQQHKGDFFFTACIKSLEECSIEINRGFFLIESEELISSVDSLEEEKDNEL